MPLQNEENNNVTINNVNAKENAMTNNNSAIINTNENAKTVGQFIIDFQKNGNGAVIPVINGKEEQMLMIGYTSEEDMRAGIKVVKDAILATNGNVYQAQQYIFKAMLEKAKGIEPDEVVNIEGNEMLISYAEQKIYLDTYEVANLDDIEGSSTFGNEAVKELLKARAAIELQQLAEQLDDFDDDEEDY